VIMPSLEVCVKAGVPNAEPDVTTEAEASQRRVTPLEPPTAKKLQQKKVNQMTLSSFFHRGNSKKAPATAPMKAESTRRSPSMKHGSQVLQVEVVEPTDSIMQMRITSKVCVTPSTTSKPPHSQDKAELSKAKNTTPIGSPAKSQASLTVGDTSNDPTADISPVAGVMGKAMDETAIPSETAALPPVDAEPNQAEPSLAATSRPRSTRKRKATLTDTAAAPKVPAEQAVTAEVAPGDTSESVDIEICIPQNKAPQHKKQRAAEPGKQAPPEPLSEDRQALLQKHADMSQRCQQRSRELVQVAREGLEEEQFDMPQPELLLELPSGDEFPDTVVKNMAVLIEGR
jgi:hypothetical protein